MKVIYIDIDTLRQDHVGCYGYPHNITPNLDKIARDGVRFKNAFAANTPCMPARASILTGKFGINNGVETHGNRSLMVNCSPNSMLPYKLSLQNIYTATISSFGRHPAPWFYNGWCDITDPSLIYHNTFQSTLGENVNKIAIKWLGDNKDKDFFLHIHYWDPHTPMNVPQEYIDKIDYCPETNNITDEEIETLAASDKYRAGKHWGIKNRKDLENLIARYDAEILYADDKIGEIIDYLEKTGIYDETMIIASSDHGEQFGEACMYQEHGTVHESIIRVLLIIKPPAGIKTVKENDSMVYSMDIGPTVCEYFGVEADDEWHGESLSSLIRGDKQKVRDYAVCDHGLYTCQRAIRESRWKLVITYHPGIWNFPDIQLFDLENDPYEKVNVAEQYKEEVMRLRKIENSWIEQYGEGRDKLKEIAKQGPQAYERCRNIKF